MPETLCYAECRDCAWTHSGEDDTRTEHAASYHRLVTRHMVKVNYLGSRK
jgi:hypothetical protein